MKEKEENVRADCSGSGHTAEAERKRGPAILGKFRSADALAEAYSALQAEFTRRSQRLRELERKAENPEAKAGGNLQAAEKPQQREPGRETEVCSESSVSRKVAARSFRLFVRFPARRFRHRPSCRPVPERPALSLPSHLLP